ncbi:hypothetical protein K435DRAFT_861201 [Dendrothele bispora CBS 962.96]|uniref:Uncharacterized protein n=1 Tax=Dendrothele bispora (strain CBS 962.96) TaxID=1314807 RepID=A0A4S8LVZ5_DENBC|nr:hypothetical protein K435DRAFT_861201 [Dendrothele bispora CBS 962.96]
MSFQLFTWKKDNPPYFPPLGLLTQLVPSGAIAVALGQPGIDAFLTVSQVIFSVMLPFISFLLVYSTSKKSIICVKVPASSANLRARSGTANHENLGGLIHATLLIRGDGKGVGDYDEKYKEEKELEA